MSMDDTTSRLISAYAEFEPEREPWAVAHELVKLCWRVEADLELGVRLFRTLVELESIDQSLALRGKSPGELSSEGWHLRNYQAWLEAAEKREPVIGKLLAEGFAIEGLDDFRATIEEARTLIGNIELEAEIRPFEELSQRAKPENPDPARYTED